jgi:hypothetical protein
MVIDSSSTPEKEPIWYCEQVHKRGFSQIDVGASTEPARCALLGHG